MCKALRNPQRDIKKGRAQGTPTQMASHCTCVLWGQIIPSYLTASQPFISTLYNNSFHMTGGSAINKIKSQKKGFNNKKKKKKDIRSGIKSGKQQSSIFFSPEKKKNNLQLSELEIEKGLEYGIKNITSSSSTRRARALWEARPIMGTRRNPGPERGRAPNHGV